MKKTKSVEIALDDQDDDYTSPEPIQPFDWNFKKVEEPAYSSLECPNAKCRCKDRIKKNEALKRKETAKDE